MGRRWSPAAAGSSAAGSRRRCSSAASASSRSTARRTTEKPSALGMLGIEDELVQVEGDLVDGEELAAILDRERVDTVYHLAAETIVSTVQASPVAGFESNVRGTWTLLAGVSRARGRARRRRLVRQGLRRPRLAALPRGLRAAGDGAVRGVEGGDRHHRPLVLPQLRPAARGDPVREHLRRRRPQLLAAGPRGGERGDRRPPAGAALRRLAGARLPLRRGRRRTPTSRSSDRLDSDDVRGEAFNAGGGQPHRVGDVVALIARLAGHRRRARHPRNRQPRRRDRPAVRRRDEADPGHRLVALVRDRGRARANDRLVPRAPRVAGAAELGGGKCREGLVRPAGELEVPGRT